MLEAILDKNVKVEDSLSEEDKFNVACELLEPDLAAMFVTPKNIDEAVKRVSYTISEAINKFFEL